MARKRAQNSEGKFVGDNPETPNVNEAWVEVPEQAETPEPAAEVEASVEDQPEAPVSTFPPAPTKEAIETDVKTRLSRKAEQVDPFAPKTSAQVEAEAKRVAKEKGFDLNRGTSIGARLMARRNLI